ncbi:STAS domain-containing protein [Streptomyces sp. A7024]|uniref:Anti-sigma factor antagonist n=1 Tax=Streptomyces coryli TaxID=1128680 RepID=A0A6G4U5Z4_9ACTN|nr:STAS domain-containing protein [Streptomyces coryli]NGN67422.1 STAS domain-containing protein [Streptomyces coryli]
MEQTTSGLAAPGLRERTAGGHIVVELSGELDLRAAGLVTARLDTLTAASRVWLVVDLSAVTFLDCGGLGALCRARRRTVWRGGRIALVVTDPRILRVLKVTGLHRAFEVHADVASAVSAPVRVPQQVR